jgi:cell division GTPase FtsZ
MAEIVKKVINQINVGDESLFDNEINITKATRNTLNNLDDVDDNVGTFNVKIFGIGGAGCNVISHMYQTQK